MPIDSETTVARSDDRKQLIGRCDGTTELKMDTSKDKINSADIGYNPATNVLFVPTFFHNTVKAYSLN